MEIKDLNVALEQLDDVRGGQTIDVSNLALQAGLNSADSYAGSWGVGNATSSGVSQIAPQSLTQGTAINAKELHSFTSTIDQSVVGFGFPRRMMLA